ncbi:GntR family transcriptional regulator [Salisediminibacterium selenitireducens]|uniref:Transcriptional regulator, GntR family with LacI sensor n=1 Tax=Bacillus selenitireducens (strain ATCC 700615 / DSM 15326 / MLS10) TaxID=439292 RepID=D6XWP2_BACIE|nr:GntR family transcriptional regulator [Salisediminibacterium selenitireducens]ADH97884.1 transcriptional regulator, GntR family with LacI sensor [[Bacillus] selenitireducens MLS10]
MEPKYNQVKNSIRSKILQGYFKPHEKIGSESELMQSYEVSRHTVRKAIDDLVNEGWIYKKQGAGTFCAERSVSSDAVSNGTKNIAVITTYFSDYIFPTIIRGIEGYLSANGYQMTVFSTNNDPDLERKYLETVLSGQFDGLIIEPTKSALPNPNINYYLNIERLGIPYVMINAYYEELEPVHLIMNDAEGGRIATRQVIDEGHKQILGFFKNDDIQGIKRMKGFIKAHRESGLQITPQNIVTYTTETRKKDPVERLKEKMKVRHERPTAIVCYNDQLAVILLDVLRDLNLSIPGDVSVIGFDDSFLSVASEVKLTTVKHPKERMGVDAAKLIDQLIREKEDPTVSKKASSIVYEPELVVRNSTKDLKIKEVN